LRERLFTATRDLPEGATRPAIKTIHINKCPVVVPENILNDAAAQRLSIDREQHYQHLAMLNAAGDLTEKLNQIFKKPDYEQVDDTDASLYSGGFFSGSDKRMMDMVREADAGMLKTLTIPFEDHRLDEMLFRYRARNWPKSLSEEEQEQWQQYRQQRLNSDENDQILNLNDFFAAIDESRQTELTDSQIQVLEQLEAYGNEVKQDLKL
jgi:exodeoxyribonuclease-1